MYLPTSHICVFASEFYTKDVNKFLCTSKVGGKDGLIPKIVKKDFWNDFYLRNKLPKATLIEEFEFINLDIEDKVYADFR